MKFAKLLSIACLSGLPLAIEAFSPSTTFHIPKVTNRNHVTKTTTTTMTHLKASTAAIPDASTSTTSSSGTNAVIVGGGPAGLLSAIMLAKKSPHNKIKVFDRLDPPPSPTDESVWSDVAKFYLIGLGARGQKALAKFGVWDDVEDVCTAVVGRRDWSPEDKSDEGTERIYTDRPYTTQVLPRDKLVGVLQKHIVDGFSDQIELNYNSEVTPIDFKSKEGQPVVLSISKCTTSESNRVNPTSVGQIKENDKSDDELCVVEDTFTISTDFLIAADGTGRTIANKMEADDKDAQETMNAFQKLFAPKPFQVTRYVDDNQRIYKTIPMKLPKDWRPDLNYSARTKDGRVNFDALPADEKGNFCGVLLLKRGDEFAEPNSDPQKLRALLDDVLPQFSALIEEENLLTIAKKPPSFLPSFRYAGPRLHQDDATVILGDSAHTVKPYFGLGANSALEDVAILSDILDSTSSVSEAVKQFTEKRAKESEALVKISRELDRPGLLGVFSFIFPLIMDSIFNKIAPKVFGPNMIAMLQREGMGFQQVRRKKRLDRFLQIVCIGSVLKGIVYGTKKLIQSIASITGKSNTGVASIMVGAATALFALQKLKFFLNGDLAPADVLNKTKGKVTDNNETFVMNSVGVKKKTE